MYKSNINTHVSGVSALWPENSEDSLKKVDTHMKLPSKQEQNKRRLMLVIHKK
jgi:hypothetical protein